MRKQIILGAALALGLASPAMAQSFEDYDMNSDGNLTYDEFYGSVGDWGTYSDWDTSGDGLVDETEFNDLGYDYDFDTWDADGNTYLDSGEFYDGIYNTYSMDGDSTMEETGHWDITGWDDAGDDGWFDV